MSPITTEVQIADPSADIRDEIAAASGVPEMPNKIWFQKTAAGVIDADRCVGCGSCIAACPSGSIGIGEDGRPTLIRMCTGCSACWDYCPMAGLRTERLALDVIRDRTELAGEPSATEAGTSSLPLLGRVLDNFSARAVERAAGAQDGGIVTALLAELLRSGYIDGVLMNQRLDALHGRPVLATTPEEIEACAGSVYHQSHLLASLNDRLPKGVERVALVGTPCQVSGLTALQRFPWHYRDTAAGAVVLTVALFCTRSFDPDLLGPAIAAEGVDLDQVSKVDVRAGQMIAQDGDGGELMRVPVRDMRDAALQGCLECTDYTGLVADLSVGSMGSDPGWTTLLVRSDEGREALEKASGALEVLPGPDMALVEKSAAADLRRAGKVLARGFDADGGLWISYTSHLRDYAETDRSAAAPPPFRSQHYEVNC